MENDQELIKRCLGGEDSAWEALLKLYARRTYNLCYRFTGKTQEAEDLTQEIFVKVFQTFRTYDATQGTFATWLHRVSRNHLVDHYRRTKKDRMTTSLDDQTMAVAEKPGLEGGPAARVEARERQERLQRGLNQMSPDLREAVILRDLQDLDYQEIALVLGVPEGTVKSRINRGRLELARVLKRMEGMKGRITEP